MSSIFSRLTDGGKNRRMDEVVVYDPLEKELWLEEKEKVRGKHLIHQ
jgi:hypothetical protein